MYNQEVCGPIDMCADCKNTVEKMVGIEVRLDFVFFFTERQ